MRCVDMNLKASATYWAALCSASLAHHTQLRDFSFLLYMYNKSSIWVIECREGRRKQQKYKSISNPKFLMETKRYFEFCYVRIFHVIKYLIMGGFFKLIFTFN